MIPLPTEIVDMVCSETGNLADEYEARQSLKSLRLVNKRLCYAATPKLFSCIGLWMGSGSLSSLKAISEHPEISQMVIKLVFSPVHVADRLDCPQEDTQAWLKTISSTAEELAFNVQRHEAAYSSFVDMQKPLTFNPYEQRRENEKNKQPNESHKALTQSLSRLPNLVSLHVDCINTHIGAAELLEGFVVMEGRELAFCSNGNYALYHLIGAIYDAKIKLQAFRLDCDLKSENSKDRAPISDVGVEDSPSVANDHSPNPLPSPRPSFSNLSYSHGPVPGIDHNAILSALLRSQRDGVPETPSWFTRDAPSIFSDLRELHIGGMMINTADGDFDFVTLARMNEKHAIGALTWLLRAPGNKLQRLTLGYIDYQQRKPEDKPAIEEYLKGMDGSSLRRVKLSGHVTSKRFIAGFIRDCCSSLVRMEMEKITMPSETDWVSTLEMVKNECKFPCLESFTLRDWEEAPEDGYSGGTIEAQDFLLGMMDTNPLSGRWADIS